MTDRPILFSPEMVRALVEGSKTQTRRILNERNTLVNGNSWHQWSRDNLDREKGWVDAGPSPAGNRGPYLKLPYCGDNTDWQKTVHRVYPCIQPGDRLWVREAWRAHKGYNAYPPREMSHWPVFYCADGAPDPRDEMGQNGRLRASIHMPRWASRLTLIVTEVRVQKLQAITRGDAMSEGCPFPNMQAGPNPRDWYADLWNQINGPGAWEANPWVAAYTFTVHHSNIDRMPS